MVRFLDLLVAAIHFAVIGIAAFAWIFPATRDLHFWVINLTLASWTFGGLIYGWGYCALTDWQWRLKRARGIEGLPEGFIVYYCGPIAKFIGGDEAVDKAVIVMGVTFFTVAWYFKINELLAA